MDICKLPSVSSFIEHVLWVRHGVGSSRATNVNLLVLFSWSWLSFKHSPQAVLAVAAVP